MATIKGLILAAGRGTRLRPLTDHQPKPLVPIAGKPILQYNIENLREAGIHEIVIVVNGNAPDFISRFGDGTALNVHLTYVEQKQLLGTAHAVYQAKEALGEEPFVLIFGDNMTGYRLTRLVEDFQRLGGCGMLAVSEGGDPRKHAVISVAGDRVCLIEERPAQPKSPYTSAGMFAFDPTIFHAIEQIRPVANGEYYLPHAIQVLIDQDRPVHYTVAADWRVNINAPADVLQALQHVLGDAIRSAVAHPLLPPATEVELGARVNIQGRVSFGRCTYVGNDCRIGRNTHIVNSMIMDNVVIGSECFIHNAILGDGVVIPDGTCTNSTGAPLVVANGGALPAA